MHLTIQYRILQISLVGSSDMITFFDTSRCRFAKFSRLFRTFHTSLSFVAYDSMEFHLTGGMSRTSKRYHPCFYLLGKCRMPRVSVHTTLWMRREIFRRTYPQAWNVRVGLMERYCIRRFLDAEFYEKSTSKSYVNSNHRLAEYQ